MKYMGSKRWMLNNGLGELLCNESTKVKRFFDLFAGTGAVSTFIAERISIPVIACDLQEYSVILTNAIINREKVINASNLWGKWYQKAASLFNKIKIPVFKTSKKEIYECRKWCAENDKWPITKAYGGYYFSHIQALWIDAFRKSIPKNEPNKTLAIAALIDASSRCSASPGHTAQPFQPTKTAKKYLLEAWGKNIPEYTFKALCEMSRRYAKIKGIAMVDDASMVAPLINSNDLVFIDPPYSSVQYSRFYHVLETIAQGQAVEVEGAGRYPAHNLRPQSLYCLKSLSEKTLFELLCMIAKHRAKVILTYPAHECSNGLSGETIIKKAGEIFDIKTKIVNSNFSTLGGSNQINSNRRARHIAKELILILTPRKRELKLKYPRCLCRADRKSNPKTLKSPPTPTKARRVRTTRPWAWSPLPRTN